MEKLKNSSALKMICYILIPFIVLEIVFSIMFIDDLYLCSYRDIGNFFKPTIIVLIYIPMIVIGAMIIYLFSAIGYKDESGKIDLNAYDKIPYEIVAVPNIIIIFISFVYFYNWYYSNGRIVEFLKMVLLYFLTYTMFATLGVTTIKRIKANTLIKNTLIYKLIKWIINKLDNIKKNITWNEKTEKKFVIYYTIFILISCGFGFLTIVGNVLSIFLIGIFWIWTGYKIMKYMKQINDVQTYLQRIYEGENTEKLNKDGYESNLKQMIIYIDNLSSGFNNAVNESIKSERMKTELITNVSHDIKTPLTSIINYVDLLKKEDIDNEKVQEYLDILDKKSQRLKRLTEDLVEASKASSGNIKLNIEKINIKELINQVSGEFEDKLKAKKLELILDMPKEEILIDADGKYMFRIIENMYSNISKYALDGSRVYVDITKNNDKVKIELKNISKEKLNITADELMQRFVRGEKSRNTEGSGLGLSIAQSLTELQGGEFKIHLDGDLFKVIIEFIHII